MHILDLLNFAYIVMFDVETAQGNARLAILEGLVLQISFAPTQPLWVAE